MSRFREACTSFPLVNRNAVKIFLFLIFSLIVDCSACAAEQHADGHLYMHIRQNPTAACVIGGFTVFLLFLLTISCRMIYLLRKQREGLLDDHTTAEIFSKIVNDSGIDFFQLSLDFRRLDTRGAETCLWKYGSLDAALAPESDFVAEDAPLFREQLTAVASGKAMSCKMPFRTRQGEVTHHYVFFGMRRYSAVFQCDVIAGYVQDLSEQRLLQDRLHDSEAMLSATMALAPSVIVVKNIDDDFRIVACNACYLSRVNLPRESVVGRREWELLPQSEYDRVHQGDLSIIKSGNTQPVECVLLDALGKNHVMRLFRHVYKNSDGVRLLLVVGVDITEEKKMQRKIADTQNYLDAVLATHPCVVSLKDINNDFRYVDCNTAMCRMSGLTKEKIIGQNDAVLFPDEDFYVQARDDLKASKEESTREKTVLCFKDRFNTKCTVQVRRSKIKYGGRELLLSVAADVTELEDLRFELQKTRRILEVILDKVPAWVAVKDKADQFRYLLWNRKAEALTGIAASDIIGKTDFDFPILCREAQAFRENSRLAENGYYHVQQYDWTAPDGQSFFLEGHLSQFECGEQKLEVALCYDITAQRERNTAEREKRIVLDSFKMPVMLFDYKHKLLYANPAALEIAAVPFEKMSEMPCHAVFCRNGQYPVNCPVEQSLADKKTHQLPHKIGGRDYVWTAVPISENDTIRYVLCWLHDVTEPLAKQQELNHVIEKERVASEDTISFLSSLVFGLRGSMNSLVGAAELVLGGQENGAISHEEFDTVKISENQILELLDNTVEFIKLKTGRFRNTTEAFVPALFFNELKKSVPSVINFDYVASPMPGLRLNVEALRTILLSWIIGIGNNETHVRLEVLFSGRNRLEFRLPVAGAAQILNKKAGEPGFRLAQILVGKLGGKVIADENNVTLVIESAERI